MSKTRIAALESKVAKLTALLEQAPAKKTAAKRGRPCRKAGEKSSKQILFTVTPSEFIRLQGSVGVSRMNRSRYIRTTLGLE